MKLPRRTFLKFAGATVAAQACSTVGSAQAFPTRPITLIVPFAAGGPTDVGARVIAEGMRTSLGQSIIIENVGGADGSIGVGRVARAQSDGYTISYGLLSTQVLNGAFPVAPDIEHESAARAQDTEGFPEDRRLIREEHNPELADDVIEHSI